MADEASSEVARAVVGYEVPGVPEGVDHPLIQGPLLCSGQVLLQLLHARHADDDSVSQITLMHKLEEMLLQ